MKLTKTLALAALVAGSLLAGSTALQAQDNTNTPPAKAHRAMHGRPNLDQIAKDLGLTEDQTTKFKAALEDQQTKMTELRKDTSLAQEDKRAKAKEIREATQAKLKEILTADQLEKFQKNRQQHRPPTGAEPKQ